MALVGFNTAAAGAPGEVHTTQKNDIGARSTDGVGNEYVYLPGVAGTVAGSWVTINPAAGIAGMLTVLLTATAVGPVAIATAACVASTWGWYLVKGYYSGAHAGSNGTIVSGAGALAAEVSSGGTGRVVLFAAASSTAAALAEQIRGAYSYSAQPDSDSAATGTPGADQIVVYINYPFIPAVSHTYA